MRLIHRMMRAWRLRARDEGAVTAEFAVALPAVIAVLALCLSCLLYTSPSPRDS